MHANKTISGKKRMCLCGRNDRFILATLTRYNPALTRLGSGASRTYGYNGACSHRKLVLFAVVGAVVLLGGFEELVAAVAGVGSGELQ